MAKSQKAFKVERKRVSTVKRIDRTDFESLKANGFLDKYQSEAGDRFESLHYCSQFNAQAMDLAKEPVDGGKGYYEIPNHIIDAQNQIGKARRYLGELNFHVIRSFIAEGQTAASVLGSFGERISDRSERGMRQHLRLALTDLAMYWKIMPARRDDKRFSYFWRDGMSAVDKSHWS